MQDDPIPPMPPTLDYTNRRVRPSIAPPEPRLPVLPIAYPPAEPSPPLTPQLIAFVVVPILLVLGILLLWFYGSATLQ